MKNIFYNLIKIVYYENYKQKLMLNLNILNEV